MREGVAPSHYGGPGVLPRENLYILHTKIMHLRAYLHRYSRFDAQKHETIRKNIGGGIRYVVSNHIIGDIPPPPGFGAYDEERGPKGRTRTGTIMYTDEVLYKKLSYR